MGLGLSTWPSVKAYEGIVGVVCAGLCRDCVSPLPPHMKYGFPGSPKYEALLQNRRAWTKVNWGSDLLD